MRVSTANIGSSTGYQSLPGPSAQECRDRALDPLHDMDDNPNVLSGVGSTLTARPSGPKDGVHLVVRQILPFFFPLHRSRTPTSSM